MTTTEPQVTPRDLLAYTGGTVETDRVQIEPFTVTRDDAALEALRSLSHGRSVPVGDYHRLMVDGRLWMSDTPDELRDHMEPVWQMQRRGGPVLIHGLGMGLIAAAGLRLGLEVDVVEIDGDVIEAVRPWLDDLGTGTLRIHEGDAYTHQFPTGQRWAVAWHDIWPDITADNLPAMGKLHRRYGRRSDWQGSWCRSTCERVRRESNKRGWSW